LQVPHKHKVQHKNQHRPGETSTFLDRWISIQRHSHRHRQLSKSHIRLLEDLGLDLDGRKLSQRVKCEAKWHSMVDRLIAFEEEHGHLRVPKGAGLGSWVGLQRSEFRKGRMKCVAARALGAGRPPHSHPRPVPRRSDARIQRLTALGFDFDPSGRGAAAGVPASPPPAAEREPVRESATWRGRYEALREFVRDSGHARVPPPDGGEVADDLHAWLETQKRFFGDGVLPPQQARMLEEAGVDLNDVVAYEGNTAELTFQHNCEGRVSAVDRSLLQEGRYK
jgi:hypothetical protein